VKTINNLSPRLCCENIVTVALLFLFGVFTYIVSSEISLKFDVFINCMLTKSLKLL
jgi:hypothetical protein